MFQQTIAGNLQKQEKGWRVTTPEVCFLFLILDIVSNADISKNIKPFLFYQQLKQVVISRAILHIDGGYIDGNLNVLPLLNASRKHLKHSFVKTFCLLVIFI
jgi:hypothetical protein